MLHSPKWFSGCESVTSIVSINISRVYYSGAKAEKNFQKDSKEKKINKIGGQQTLFTFILSDQIIILFPANTFSRKQLIFRPQYKRLEKRSCVSV